MWTDSTYRCPTLASCSRSSATRSIGGLSLASSRNYRALGRSITESYYHAQNKRTPGDNGPERSDSDDYQTEGYSLARIILAAICVDALVFGVPALMSAAHLAGWW